MSIDVAYSSQGDLAWVGGDHLLCPPVLIGTPQPSFVPCVRSCSSIMPYCPTADIAAAAGGSAAHAGSCMHALWPSPLMWWFLMLASLLPDTCVPSCCCCCRWTHAHLLTAIVAGCVCALPLLLL